jgi:hypothetical protein
MFGLFLVTLLMGCSVVEKPVDVIKTRTEKVLIPEELLVDCDMTKPPTEEEYIAADNVNKENILVAYINSLITDIKTCNVRLDSIRKLNK